MDRESCVKHKIERLKKGDKPRTLDLFSGCGGLSLGFHASGFKIVGGIENDPLASKSHALNFFRRAPSEEMEKHAAPHDIVEVDPAELIDELQLGNPSTAIDVIIGGPPCQAYSRVGRPKLREVFDHPQAFLSDPRGNLYLRFLAYVEELRPLAILMENVPDVMNIGGHNVAEETCEVLTELGYRCGYTLLNSAFYGVPQMRERMFLIAYVNELEVEVDFPKPSHWIDLPEGYAGSRSVALKHLGVNGSRRRNGQRTLYDDEHSFCAAPPASPALRPAVTAELAIGDLPPITDHLCGKLRRGARRFDTITPYDNSLRLSDYAKRMRNWPGFSNNTGVADHVIRFLPRDYQIFRRMDQGDQYPEAHRHAIELFEEHVAELAENGETLSTKVKEKLRQQIVPPYDVGKFPNKWRKIEADKPVRTIMAHIGKDSYSHIHFDSKQARTISVREAARLHSFPDGFVFCGTMNPAFRQIGNAVPPLMAKPLAKSILRTLRKGLR